MLEFKKSDFGRNMGCWEHGSRCLGEAKEESASHPRKWRSWHRERRGRLEAGLCLKFSKNQCCQNKVREGKKGKRWGQIINRGGFCRILDATDLAFNWILMKGQGQFWEEEWQLLVHALRSWIQLHCEGGRHLKGWAKAGGTVPKWPWRMWRADLEMWGQRRKDAHKVSAWSAGTLTCHIWGC